MLGGLTAISIDAYDTIDVYGLRSKHSLCVFVIHVCHWLAMINSLERAENVRKSA